MKFKDYLNSLVLKRKTNPTKTHRQSNPTVQGKYDVCTSEDSASTNTDERYSRTEVLLARHAQLINTIVRTRNSDTTNFHQTPLFENIRAYPNSMTMPHQNHHCHGREHQHHNRLPIESRIVSNSQSLWGQTRQRTKIRTNPWIKTSSMCDQRDSSSLINSESFSQRISKNCHPIHEHILPQSDSGRGFSLSSSRMIDSSSPDDVLVKDEGYRLSMTNSPHRNSVDSPSYRMNSSANRIQSKRRSSPFILPLNNKNDDQPISKDVDAFENEILCIENINFEPIESLDNATFFTNDDGPVPVWIHDQVDQWVDACLTQPKTKDQISTTSGDSELRAIFYVTTNPCENSSHPTSSITSQSSKPFQECPI